MRQTLRVCVRHLSTVYHSHHFVPLSFLDYPMTSEEIVLRFMQAGLVDSAMSSAASLKVDMAAVFSTLTTQCMRLSYIPDNEV